jgi:PAS domain S-box-containing protein
VQSSRTLDAQRLIAIIDGSDDAIISKNLKGEVTSWNRSATRMFGYTAEEMIGRPISILIPADLRGEEAQILARLTHGERIDHFDTVRLAKNGDWVDVSLTVSPLYDASGAIVGASKIARDISNRRKIERSLREAYDALVVANAEAEKSRLAAENANRAKTEFLAVMSHEIRTPLNSIKGFIDLMTTATSLTPQQRRYADLVRAASAALMTVVDDILDFSKVEAGELGLERTQFSLEKLVRETVEIVSASANAKNLSLNLTIDKSSPEWVVGDHSRLRQVLLNLLNNAVKFTDTGTIHVEVRPQTAAGAQGRLYFSVSDTGVGIPDQVQQRLFKRFSQGDSSVSRKYGGTGLGLAICKRLVELMNGEIGVSSELDRGSTFWFDVHLPSASGQAPEAAPRKARDAVGGRGRRILVVDDIDANLEIVEAFLRDRGYLVDCVSSALDAIQLLSSTHFDLILMDVQMPVMDGVTATRRIRALPTPIGDIPIIAMTGNVLPEQVRSFLAAGMNDHVGKPIDRAKLCNNVRRWLSRADGARGGAAERPSNYQATTFEDFVELLGEERTKTIAEKFARELSDAFNSTFAETQREAHSFINVAGLLGLQGFVAACRKASEFAFSDKPDRCDEMTRDLQRARMLALQAISKRILPRLQRGASPPSSLLA